MLLSRAAARTGVGEVGQPGRIAPERTQTVLPATEFERTSHFLTHLVPRTTHSLHRTHNKYKYTHTHITALQQSSQHTHRKKSQPQCRRPPPPLQRLLGRPSLLLRDLQPLVHLPQPSRLHLFVSVSPVSLSLRVGGERVATRNAVEQRTDIAPGAAHRLYQSRRTTCVRL